MKPYQPTRLALAAAIASLSVPAFSQNALEEIKTLKGIIPICMHCKKIRDDQGYWNQIEKYISEHSTAEISHGLCPECLREHYPAAATKLGMDSIDSDEDC